MPTYDDDGNLIEEENTLDSKMDTILEKLTSSEDSATQKLGKVLSDPAYQEILAARERGETVRVVTETDDPSPVPDDSTPIEDLDNKGLLDHMEQRVGKILEDKLKDVITPIRSSVESLNTIADGVQKEKSLAEATRLRKLHTDFDQHKDQMIELNQTNPNLSLEQLYTLASAGKEKTPPPEEMETERPSNVATRQSRPERKTPLPLGRAGFKQLMSEGTERGVSKAIADNT